MRTRFARGLGGRRRRRAETKAQTRAEALESRTLLAVVPPVPDFRVNSTIEGTQWKPAIAADANGDFVVAWAGGGGQDGDGYGIYAQRYNPAGQPQGTEFLINTTTQRSQMNPSVAIDGAGIVRRNLLQSLPAAEPTSALAWARALPPALAAALAARSASAAVPSATRDLFSAVPILN